GVSERRFKPGGCSVASSGEQGCASSASCAARIRSRHISPYLSLIRRMRTRSERIASLQTSGLRKQANGLAPGMADRQGSRSPFRRETRGKSTLKAQHQPKMHVAGNPAVRTAGAAHANDIAVPILPSRVARLLEREILIQSDKVAR